MEQKNQSGPQDSCMEVNEHTGNKSRQVYKMRPQPELAYVCFIRHGERCDNSPDPMEVARIELPWDPPLTHAGEAQARMTGDYLKKMLIDHNYQFVVIESSPWIRTLQTAAAIAQQIGIPEIRVNFRYSEWMKDKFFPDGNPIGMLYIDQMPPETLKKRFLHGIELDLSGFQETRKLVENNFPEKYGATAGRINDALSSLRSMYKYTEKRTAHIVVTHGANVSTFNQRFGEIYNSVPISSYIDYCGISAITLKGRSARLLKGGNAKHIQQGPLFNQYIEQAKKRSKEFDKPSKGQDDDEQHKQ